MVDDIDDPEAPEGSLGQMFHGHVLETAKCKYRLHILESLLIKRGITTKEELDSLYRDSLETRLPEEFNKIEVNMGCPDKHLVFEKDGSIWIKNCAE